MHTSSKKGKAMACRIAISFAAVAMGISCIATDASATCKFKAKKDIIVILDVGHTDRDSGQISARGVKEYDFNMDLARFASGYLAVPLDDPEEPSSLARG